MASWIPPATDWTDVQGGMSTQAIIDRAKKGRRSPDVSPTGQQVGSWGAQGDAQIQASRPTIGNQAQAFSQQQQPYQFQGQEAPGWWGGVQAYRGGSGGLMDIGRGSEDWYSMSPAQRTDILSAVRG